MVMMHNEGVLTDEEYKLLASDDIEVLNDLPESEMLSKSIESILNEKDDSVMVKRLSAFLNLVREIWVLSNM